MKSFALVSALLCCFGSQIYAQSELEFSIGVNQSYIKDRHFSPLNYTHSGLNLNVNFHRISKSQTSRLYIQTDLLNQDLEPSTYTHLTSSFIAGNLKVGYQKRIKTSGKFNMYLGGGYQFGMQYINFDDQESYSYLITHSLNISLFSTYKLNGVSELGGALSIPAFPFIVRPPYNGINEELDKNKDRPLKLITDGEFYSIDEYFRIQLMFFYRYQISTKIAAKVSYNSVYQSLNRDKAYTRLQNQINLGIIYTL